MCGDILQRFGCAEIFFIGSDVLRKKLQRFGCAEIAIRCAELAFFSFSTSAHLNHCFSTPELFLSTPDISAHLTYISAHLAYVSAHFPQHTWHKWPRHTSSQHTWTFADFISAHLISNISAHPNLCMLFLSTSEPIKNISAHPNLCKISPHTWTYLKSICDILSL